MIIFLLRKKWTFFKFRIFLLYCIWGLMVWFYEIRLSLKLYLYNTYSEWINVRNGEYNENHESWQVTLEKWTRGFCKKWKARESKERGRESFRWETRKCNRISDSEVWILKCILIHLIPFDSLFTFISFSSLHFRKRKLKCFRDFLFFFIVLILKFPGINWIFSNFPLKFNWKI